EPCQRHDLTSRGHGPRSRHGIAGRSIIGLRPGRDPAPTRARGRSATSPAGPPGRTAKSLARHSDHVLGQLSVTSPSWIARHRGKRYKGSSRMGTRGAMSVSSEQKRKEGGLAETLRVIFHALIIALVIRTFLFQPFNIPSGSMKATLLVGDY